MASAFANRSKPVGWFKAQDIGEWKAPEAFGLGAE
jgi:hypothetical protein